MIAARGVIKDRNGVVLADNRTAYSVFVRPNAVEDVQMTAVTLASLLGGGMLCRSGSRRRRIRAYGRKTLIAFTESWRNIPGVYYAQDNVRVYPYGELLSRVLGFTSSDNTG